MKKVLIITYYWPPAGGPGVQRVLKFAKYLPQFGWEPVILTVKEGEYPAIDKSLEQEVSSNIKVFKTKTTEPFKFYKALSGSKGKPIDTYALTEKKTSVMTKLSKWVRLNLFIPDARRGWVKYAVREGLKIAKDENVDLIFSSSPPHSLQLAAKKIAQRTGLPWVADFRDLWSDAFYIPTNEQSQWAKNRNIKLEHNILFSTTHVTTTSSEIKSEFLKKCPGVNISVVYNGYDDDDFSENIPSGNEYFTVRYFGFLSSGQSPKALFSALKTLSKNNSEVYDKISVEFYGNCDESVMLTIREMGLEDKVILKGYVAHSEVTHLMSESDCLLLLLPISKYRGMVPGKLFEYMAARKKILAIGDTKSEVADILSRTASGEMFEHTEDITPFLIGEFQEKERGRINNVGNAYVESFSRQEVTRKLAGVFNNQVQ